jgi:hypothetical protein
MNAFYDPLAYVVMFIDGMPGWSPTVRDTLNGKVSPLQFYRYLLQVRVINGVVNGGLLYYGRLLHQFIVDVYTKIEAQRIRYIRLNQNVLNRNGGPDAPVRLPSSFVGGPRYMQQSFQDSMCVVREYGVPDYFITMTTNAEWPEITDMLLPGQTDNDRPDAVNRVFYQKLCALLKMIQIHRIFGQCVGLVHTIEFQKRGLPHAHILVTVVDDDKPRSAQDIDMVIRAELPSEDEGLQILRERVSKFMRHGPCAEGHACWVNGQCKRGYPKPYEEHTVLPEKEFPVYRRRQRNENGPINSQMIVPYSPYLILAFNCHINVEACMSIDSVKYLFKVTNETSFVMYIDLVVY